MTLLQLKIFLEAIPIEWAQAEVKMLHECGICPVDTIEVFRPGNMDPTRPMVLLVEFGSQPEDHFEPDLSFTPR